MDSADDERALFRAATRILGELALEDVLRETADAFCELSGARSSMVLLLEASTGTLRGVTGSDVERERVRAARLYVEESPTAGRALAAGRPRPVEPDDALAVAAGFQRTLCAPIAHGGRTHGLVVLDGIDLLDAATESRLTELAGAAGHAWENALRHRRAEAFGALATAGRAADELHDTFAQTLYAIRTLAALPAPTPDALERIRALSGHAADELRAALRLLRLGSSVALGLGSALDEVAAAARARGDLIVEVEVAPELAEADDSAAEALFLASREGVALVEGEASLRIRCRLESGWAVATVESAGDAAPAFRNSGRLGIAFAQEALEGLGGTLAISAGDTEQPFLTARVPADRLGREVASTRRRRRRAVEDTPPPRG